MSNIVVKEIRADQIYKKMMTAQPDKKSDIYRYELMQPFKGKRDMTTEV